MLSPPVLQAFTGRALALLSPALALGACSTLPAQRPRPESTAITDYAQMQWLRLNDDGSLTVFDEPPETTAWQRFKLRLFGPLIPVRDL